MLRRVISTAVLVASAVGLVLANERATFILTDGQRKSGEITSRPSDKDVPINASFTIMDASRREDTILASQVAVIDVAGGQPDANELAKLPSTGHYLVLRNGVSGPGTFVNVVGGDTLIWRSERGDEQRYALKDVTRVYLNAPSARTAFNYNGPTNAVGTAGLANTPGTVQVSATQAWTDTGMDVRRGDRLGFRSSGEITFAPGQASTADGKQEIRSNAYPVPIAPVGALIGKVGNSAPFSIGSNAQSIVMPQNGRLMLGVNDNILTDNGGAFTVVVTKNQ